MGQFLTIFFFFCSSLCKDLSDNLTETPIVKNSLVYQTLLFETPMNNFKMRCKVWIWRIFGLSVCPYVSESNNVRVQLRICLFVCPCPPCGLFGCCSCLVLRTYSVVPSSVKHDGERVPGLRQDELHPPEQHHIPGESLRSVPRDCEVYRLQNRSWGATGRNKKRMLLFLVLFKNILSVQNVLRYELSYNLDKGVNHCLLINPRERRFCIVTCKFFFYMKAMFSLDLPLCATPTSL